MLQALSHLHSRPILLHLANIENKSLSVPIRTSSKAAIDHQRLHLQTSRADLKRKLSETSTDEAPTKYRKLRCDDLDLQQEESMLTESRLNLEHKLHQISNKNYRKKHQATRTSES